MDEIPSTFPEPGKIKKERLPLIIFASRQANRQDHFLHNPWVIAHNHQVKNTLRLGWQAVNRCVSLPVQYEAFRATTSHTGGSHAQDGARPGSSSDMLTGEVTNIEPHWTGPSTTYQARSRSMVEAGQAGSNPLSSVVTEP